MAARKIPFYGSHDAGCTYPAGVFACDGERFMLCDTLPDATGPALEIRSDSSFDPEDGRKALLYW
ncbi:MAG: hypothetical protein L6Q71_09000, partial [Planctomycetes bacterium]|nr:hypothetical protein [Planctomycetota bacterium]